jgi:hypothetical protein
MGLAVVMLLLALAASALLGGSWDRLARIRLRWRRLVVAAVAAQVGGSAVGVLGLADSRRSYVVGLAVSAACALAFCARNLRVAGVTLITGGLVANALVVAMNGAMPVSIVGALRAGVPIRAIALGTDPRHDIAGIGTRWRWLGDVIPAPLPLRPEVVSPGDVLIAAGLVELVVVGMMGWSRRKEPTDGEEGA